MPALSMSFNNLGEFALCRQALGDAGLGGRLPFVEILWDNYCHLDAYQLRDFLAPLADQVSFHVMMSKFLQRSGDELAGFLARLREHVQVVRPVRVSDHLARFRLGNLNTVVPLELPYRRVANVAARIMRYQEAIAGPLLLENFGSDEPHGARQVEFVGELVSRTGCGLLFDVSNAVVAELNGFLPVSAWRPLLAGAEIHCHVGGYRLGQSGDLFHDSHDSPISARTESALGWVMETARVATLCYERDHDKTAGSMADDLRLLARVTWARPAGRRQEEATA